MQVVNRHLIGMVLLQGGVLSVLLFFSVPQYTHAYTGVCKYLNAVLVPLGFCETDEPTTSPQQPEPPAVQPPVTSQEMPPPVENDTDIATSNEAQPRTTTVVNDRTRSERDDNERVTQETNSVPTPPNPPDTTPPPPAAVSPRPAERTAPTYVTNEYITNEYTTNPTTIIREVIEETVRTERTNDIDTSRFVTRDLFYNQVDTLFDSSSDSVADLSDTLDEAVATKLLTVSGNGTLSGTLSVGGPISTDAYLTALTPTATSTIAGALSVGTTTAHDTFTVGGPVYLANTSPVQTTSRLYNQNGSLYWAGKIVAGAAVGSWDASGGDIYRLTGNVGIGTSSPTARLTVAGGDTRLATTTIDGALTVNGNTSITNGGQLNVGDKIVAPGEIMLGTTTPAGKLTLQSTNAAQTGFALYGASGQSNPLLDIFSNAGSSLFRLTSGGNVGVGTSTPAHKLTVSGDVGFAQTDHSLQYNSNSVLTVTGQLDTSVNQNSTLLSFANVGQQVCDSDEYCNEAHLGLYSAMTGTSTQDYYRRYIKFGGVSSTGARNFDWYTGANAQHTYILYDALNTNHRMRFGSGGDTEINAADGANRIIFNRATGGENYGTDGLRVYDGTTNILLDVDGSGSLGVNGGATPGKGLTINNFTSALRGINSTGAYVELVRNDGAITSGRVLGGLLFKGVDDTEETGACITAYSAGTWSADISPGRLLFGTSGSADDNCDERMRIDQNGNVGIGLSSPTARLQTAGGNVQFNDSSNNPGFFFDESTGRVGLGTTSPSEKLTVDGDYLGTGVLQIDGTGDSYIQGNVGIGTTGPASKLHVAGNIQLNDSSTLGVLGGETFTIGKTNGAGSANLTLGAVTTANRAFTIDNNIGLSFGSNAGGNRLNANTGTTFLFDKTGAGLSNYQFSSAVDTVTFMNTGNVGIGTTSPSSKLDIVTADHTSILTLGQSAQPIVGNDLLGSLRFTGVDGGYGIGADIRAVADGTWTGPNDADTRLEFWVNKHAAGPLQAMTIKNSGNVGIGTTSPSSKLSVSGDVTFAGLTGATGAGSLCLNSNNEVVFNSGSDACLPSLRETKSDIKTLDVSALAMVSALESVSFTYNQGDGRTRYGFIAEDVADIDALLATYDADGNISGIDDRSMIAVVVQGMQELWSDVQSLLSWQDEADQEIEMLQRELCAKDDSYSWCEEKTSSSQNSTISGAENEDSDLNDESQDSADTDDVSASDASSSGTSEEETTGADNENSEEEESSEETSPTSNSSGTDEASTGEEDSSEQDNESQSDSSNDGVNSEAAETERSSDSDESSAGKVSIGESTENESDSDAPAEESNEKVVEEEAEPESEPTPEPIPEAGAEE